MKREERPKSRNEEEPARFYEERRGDPSLWVEKPTSARIIGSGRTVMFSLRLPAEELEMLRKEAEAQSLTVSELVRRALAEMIERERTAAVRVYRSEVITQQTLEPPGLIATRTPATLGSGAR